MPITSAPNLPALPIVVGPTASGKSAYALRLAQQLGNGVIINMDAMQLYAELPRLSAQPDEVDKRAAPHRLYGVLQGHDKATAARWVGMAKKALADCAALGQTPILCGGTGLYLKALLEGIAEIPTVPDAMMAALRAEQEVRGTPALHHELAQHDPPSAAAIKPNDTQRTLRALGVWRATNVPLSVWQQAAPGSGLSGYAVQPTVLLPPRAKLYAKINARFEAMLQQGVVDEVKNLLTKNYPAHLPIMKSHGVPELAAYLAGSCNLAAATARAQQVTRNYAKRQVTWFTHQLVAKTPNCTVINDFGA